MLVVLQRNVKYFVVGVFCAETASKRDGMIRHSYRLSILIYLQTYLLFPSSLPSRENLFVGLI